MLNTEEEFKIWWDEQVKNGMTNFGVTLNPEMTGITKEQVMRAILDSQKAIAEGRFKVIDEIGDKYDAK